MVDEDDAADAATWYQDSDSDGFGDASLTHAACNEPAGFVSDDTDCDDGDGAVHPDATEVCDAVDNDCDSVVDEDDAADASTWHLDADSDGFGDADYATVACDVPGGGYVLDSSDCDDDNGAT